MRKLKLKFIYWFYKKYPGKYCWADCVSWAYSKKINPFKIESCKGCQTESELQELCYCGQWCKGKYFSSLNIEEQEKLRKELCGEEVVIDSIPF